MKRKIMLLLSLFLTVHPVVCSASQYDDLLAKANEKAKEMADNSYEITSGDFYDSVIEIYPDVELTDMGDTVSVNIYLEHETELDDSTMFFYVVSQIIETSKVEDYYSDATFTMFVDDSFITLLTIMDLDKPSITTTDPMVLDDNYKESIETLYSISFSSNDVSNQFDKYLDELSEKYNLPD